MFSPCGKYVSVINNAGHVVIYDQASDFTEEACEIEHKTQGPIRRMAWSRKSSYIQTYETYSPGDECQTNVHLWDAETGMM